MDPQGIKEEKVKIKMVKIDRLAWQWIHANDILYYKGNFR